MEKKESMKLDLQGLAHMSCPYHNIEKMHEHDEAVLTLQASNGATERVVHQYGNVKELFKSDNLTPSRQGRTDIDMSLFKGTAYDNHVRNGFRGKAGFEHRRLRQLVSAGFSPRVLKGVQNDLVAVVTDVIEPLLDKKQIDFAAEFSHVLPPRIITSLLKIPVEYTPLLMKLSRYLMISNAAKSAASSDEKLSAIRQFNTLFPKLKSALDERRKNLLKDDFLSAVFQQEVEAEEGNADFKTPITDEEMCAMVTGLLVAGTDTTIDLLNLSMYQFLSFPEQKKVALRNSESLEKAIMEVLRHDYFISGGIGRFAVADFNFKGHDIKKGEMLRLLIGAASRDPSYYENPGEFDVTRSYKDTLAFGFGSHYCVGASLAKMESVIAISMFFEKFPNAALLEEPVWDTTHPVSRRMKSLKIQLF